MTVQHPTVGRNVYVYDLREEEPRRPYAAFVAEVGVGGNFLCINCACLTRSGGFFEDGLQRVPHISDPLDATIVWDWMPFQKGQQAKTEELERQIVKKGEARMDV
jgi:hypothetical protein